VRIELRGERLQRLDRVADRPVRRAGKKSREIFSVS
jgi:hypothetical protein